MQPIALSNTQQRLWLWDGKNYFRQDAIVNPALYPDIRTLKLSPDQYAPCYLVKSLPPYTVEPGSKPEKWEGALDKHLPKDLVATEPLPHRPSGKTQ